MTKIPTIREQFEEKFGWAGSSGTFTGIRDEEIVKFITAEREAGARQERERIKNILQRTVIDPNALSYDSRLLAASILQFKHTKEQLETALKI